MANRAAIAQAVKSQPRVARGNGGTTAPSSAAGGNGVYNNRNLTGVAGLGQKRAAPGKSPAAPAPAGSPPPSPYTPAPWDSQYELAAAGAHNKYANTVTNLGVKKTATEQDFGLTQGYNDYQSNPYSRAALLEQSFQKAQRGTGNSYASSGQLYAGSLDNAYSANRGARDQEHDSLEKQYRNALQEIRDEEVNAKNTEIGELTDAGWKRLERADQEPLDSSTAPESGSSGGGGGAAKTKANNKSSKLTPKQEKELGEAWRKLGQKGKK